MYADYTLWEGFPPFFVIINESEGFFPKSWSFSKLDLTILENHRNDIETLYKIN